jgi:hypothetical protein
MAERSRGERRRSTPIRSGSNLGSKNADITLPIPLGGGGKPGLHTYTVYLYIYACAAANASRVFAFLGKQ